MFTLEKELLGRQRNHRPQKMGRRRNESESHGLDFSRGLGREVRTSIEEQKRVGDSCEVWETLK